MPLTELEEYYNKFNEDKRLDSRHGNVEFVVSMSYIHSYIKPGDKILDLGAGTGRYSISLFNEGYDVTAVELVQHNLGRIKQKCPEMKAYKGNALRLRRFEDDSFDAVIMFGPMYHLLGHEQKLRALEEAKRVTKSGGIIFIAYIMNEYAMIVHGFRDRNIMDAISTGRVDDRFLHKPLEGDLYDYVRLDEIDKLNSEAGLERIKIISPDGPANYIRRELNSLSEEEYEEFVRYQLSVCERPELIGAGGHTVDIVRV